jgi:hypothetical protein
MLPTGERTALQSHPAMLRRQLKILVECVAAGRARDTVP